MQLPIHVLNSFNGGLAETAIEVITRVIIPYKTVNVSI